MSTGAKALTDALRVDLPDDFAATDVCMGFVPLTTRSCSGCAMAPASAHARCVALRGEVSSKPATGVVLKAPSALAPASLRPCASHLIRYLCDSALLGAHGVLGGWAIGRVTILIDIETGFGGLERNNSSASVDIRSGVLLCAC